MQRWEEDGWRSLGSSRKGWKVERHGVEKRRDTQTWGAANMPPHGDWPVKGGNSSLSHGLSAPLLSQTRSPLHSKPPSVLRTHTEGLQTWSEAVQSRSSHLSPPAGRRGSKGCRQHIEGSEDSQQEPPSAWRARAARCQQGRSPPPSQRLSLSHSARKIL